MHHTIAIRRLRNQAITGAARRTPADVVTWLGAVQAQEYGPAKWALALRTDAGTRDDHIERVICSGPRRGKQFTYALLAERAPRARRLVRDEALGTLARRFFRSHGPATVRDFVWWSGLPTSDAKRGVEIIRARPGTRDGLTYWSVEDAKRDSARDGTVHLLPVYDEYLVAYRDREAVPHWPPGVPALRGRLTALHHAVVIRGHVAGLWRVMRAASGGTRIEVVTAAPLPREDREALHAAAARYAASVGVPVSVAYR